MATEQLTIARGEGVYVYDNNGNQYYNGRLIIQLDRLLKIKTFHNVKYNHIVTYYDLIVNYEIEHLLYHFNIFHHVWSTLGYC